MVCRPKWTNSRKWFYNESIFTSINTPEKAYWLGFIATDGNVSQDGRYLSFHLAAVDASHLKKFTKFIGSKQPASIYFDKKANTEKVKLCVGSKKLVATLNKVGILPKKSHIVKPWRGPSNLVSHYWRGVIDGDGSILKQPKKWSIRCNGNFAIVSGFKKWVNTFSVATAKIFPEKSIFRFEVGGTFKPRTVANKLYKNSTTKMRLDRKWVTAKKLLTANFDNWARDRREVINI